jgi:hypothetical protein
VTTHALQPESFDTPRPSVAGIQQLAATELSMAPRIAHVLLLVASLTIAGAIGSLWATEPSLPARTHIAFAAIVGIALSWAAFAVWVLARRRVLFGADRVMAAKLGLIFSAAGAAGLAALGYWGPLGRSAYLGALLQVALCVVAGGGRSSRGLRNAAGPSLLVFPTERTQATQRRAVRWSGL